MEKSRADKENAGGSSPKVKRPTHRAEQLVGLADLKIGRFQAASKVTESRVEQIRASFEETGEQLMPLTVVFTLDGVLELFAGNNRVEAGKRVPWTHMFAKIYDERDTDLHHLYWLEHGVAPNGRGIAESVRGGLDPKVLPARQRKNVEKSAQVFRGGVHAVAGAGVALHVANTVEAAHTILSAKAEKGAAPDIQDFGDWALRTESLPALRSLIQEARKGGRVQVKRLLAAIENDRHFK